MPEGFTMGQSNVWTLLSLLFTLVVVNVSATDIYSEVLDESKFPPINYNAHILYYPWYKNESHDGFWSHWPQSPPPEYTPSPVHYKPPSEIGANYYPLLGTYSSNDSRIIDQHMIWLRSTGIGVIAVSWFPPMYSPTKHAADADKLMPIIFKTAHKYNMKVTFLLEVYEPKDGSQYGGDTIKNVCKYITENYGNQPALYKTKLRRRNKALPLYYMYAANTLQSWEWAPGLKPGGPKSVRGTPYDANFVMMFSTIRCFQKAYDGGFDAIFTYFPMRNCNYGSTWSEWPRIKKVVESFNMTFIPSVGPGFVDTRIRPFHVNTSVFAVRNGTYFAGGFKAALATEAKYLSITSFNEWHEGTMIEPARPSVTIHHTYNPAINKTDTDFTYRDFAPGSPYYYMDITRKYVSKHTLMMQEEKEIN